MKVLHAFFLIAAACVHPLAASEAPRGSVLELHSCELYAGGCRVSSEATQGGRQLLRLWDFTSGDVQGTSLKGLQVAVLQSSPDNLAEANGQTGDAVIYLPQSASAAQREALLAWVKSQPDFKPARTFTRSERLQFRKNADGCTLSIGNFVSLETKPLEACDSRSCGEELWYEPRSATEIFTVAVNRVSNISEPFLRLTWNDSAQRSVFLGRFGETGHNRELFVTMKEVCGGWM